MISNSPTTPVTITVTPGPRVRTRGRTTGWWGMMMLIATESMIFLALLSTYFYLRSASTQWPPAGIEFPELTLGWIFSFVLWGSSIPMFYAEHVIRRGEVGRARLGLMLSLIMGTAFLGYTIYDFNSLDFGWTTNAYGSIFWVTVGLHAIHVFVGLCMNAMVQIKAARGLFSAERHLSLDIFALYWHFVDAIWVFVFASLFLSAHIQ